MNSWILLLPEDLVVLGVVTSVFVLSLASMYVGVWTWTPSAATIDVDEGIMLP